MTPLELFDDELFIRILFGYPLLVSIVSSLRTVLFVDLGLLIVSVILVLVLLLSLVQQFPKNLFFPEHSSEIFHDVK